MIEEAAFKHCQRAQSYKILAECFYPLDERLVGSLGDLDKAAFEFLSEVVQSVPRADDLERHMVDYSRLFVGPFKVLAPPYGSVYLEDGKFMGLSSIEVKEMYSQEGLDIVLKEAPDHISVELEYMCLLALRETEAHDKSDLDLAASFRDKQASFLHVHLGRWVGEFADNIAKHAQTDFYKTLGRVTRDFVERNMARVPLDDGAYSTALPSGNAACERLDMPEPNG